jgi:mannosyl-oligosaccharide alpha-1,2-mannosidase
MDLKDEFSAAVDEIKKIDFTTSSFRNDIPVFETVIRYLGGLLGAYDISGQRHSELLDKAEELAEILIDIFDTPNRMPELYYSWGSLVLLAFYMLVLQKLISFLVARNTVPTRLQ